LALDRHERSVLAVSGGVDSMVLLHAAAHTVGPRRIVVATFDHGTGPVARAACAHVARWCERAGIACVRESTSRPLTTEEQFREARWRFLRRVERAENAVVTTAHTADDQLETVLMRILRGAGARGIAGLFADSGVCRPLLGHSRRDITEYAERRGLSWIE